MADSAGSAVLQSRQAADSSANRDDAMDVREPEPKKFKYDNQEQTVESKLEDRLTGILCCAVCLDVPCLWMYQASLYSLSQKKKLFKKVPTYFFALCIKYIPISKKIGRHARK